MSRAKYHVVLDAPEVEGIWSSLVIRDAGPWDRYPTVTNDAEAVVEELVADGRLACGRRLFCYDSEGDLDEILIKDGKFAGFAPGPGREKL